LFGFALGRHCLGEPHHWQFHLIHGDFLHCLRVSAAKHRSILSSTQTCVGAGVATAITGAAVGVGYKNKSFFLLGIIVMKGNL